MSLTGSLIVGKGEDGQRLDRWFKRHFPTLTHAYLQKLLRTGQVRLDGLRVKANTRIAKGQKIRIPPSLVRDDNLTKPKLAYKVVEAQIKILKDRILYMDKDILAINKPLGLPVQGGSKIRLSLDDMLDYLTFDSTERPRLVHRLDKDTTGVLILARNRKSAVMLSEAFRSKRTRKVYWAIVKGVPIPSVGLIVSSLLKKSNVGREKVEVDPDGKKASTRYSVVDHAGRNAAWLALEPITGRTHQLRVHCNQIGTPILGDRKYGNSPSSFEQSLISGRDLQLHSRAIRIPTSTGTVVEIAAPLPKHMLETWRMLGFNEKEKENLFIEDSSLPKKR